MQYIQQVQQVVEASQITFEDRTGKPSSFVHFLNANQKPEVKNKGH